MMMVAEQNIGSHHYTYWWNFSAGHSDVIAGQTDMTVTENILMQKLSEKGFNVVDHSVMSKNTNISNAYKVETLSNDAIKTIGSLYDAEVVIYGKSLAKLAGSVMGTSMKSSQADVSLRAVNTDNGQVIASATNHGAAIHPNESTAAGRGPGTGGASPSRSQSRPGCSPPARRSAPRSPDAIPG